MIISNKWLKKSFSGLRNYWIKPVFSQDPSCNLCWDITSFMELQCNTRCKDQPYLIAEGCVCVYVCVCVCMHIGFQSKNRLSGSICAQCAGKLGKQGFSRPSVLLLPPASPSCVWRQEIWVRPQSEGHVAMVYTPLTSDLSTPPPHGLSHPLPWSSNTLPWAQVWK